MIMEYSVEETKRLTVILDNLAPYDSKSFEKAVSFTASICESFLADGFFVRLLTCRKVFPFGAGRDHLLKYSISLQWYKDRIHGSVLRLLSMRASRS